MKNKRPPRFTRGERLVLTALGDLKVGQAVTMRKLVELTHMRCDRVVKSLIQRGFVLRANGEHRLADGVIVPEFPEPAPAPAREFGIEAVTRVLSELSADGVMTFSALLLATGYSKVHLHRIIQCMGDRIEKAGHGKYRLSAAARSATQPRSDDPVDQFLAEVRAELMRARTKFPGDRIMTIALLEEAGELAKALLDEPAANVRKEAVQTAVMAARVALDGDGSVRAWREAKGLDQVVEVQS